MMVGRGGVFTAAAIAPGWGNPEATGAIGERSVTLRF
jgi:hypothetical protein